MIVASPRLRKNPVSRIVSSARPSPSRARARMCSIVTEPVSSEAGHEGSVPRYRATTARFETYASQQPLWPHEHRGPYMFSGTWPNSPAVLCAPRSSFPSTAMPTPTPSDTLTNATGPSTGASPLTAHTWPSTQAFVEFSTTTGSWVAALSGCTRSTSRQPRVGENRSRPAGVDEARQGDPHAHAGAEVRVVRPASSRSPRSRP